MIVDAIENNLDLYLRTKPWKTKHLICNNKAYNVVASFSLPVYKPFIQKTQKYFPDFHDITIITLPQNVKVSGVFYVTEESQLSNE